MCNAFVILLGCLGIVDGDDVELNNLHRQVEIILCVFSPSYLVFSVSWVILMSELSE